MYTVIFSRTKMQDSNFFERTAINLLGNLSSALLLANSGDLHIVDGQAICLAVFCFYSKHVVGPRTAKFQPIWIKFCTHLLLYSIHLWAYLDRDRRVGSSRQTKTTVFLL